MARRRIRFKTVFISDVHLGMEDCKITEVIDFLKSIECETLVLNGDIIDGWELMRGGTWQNDHSSFIRLVLKKMEKQNTEVIYLRGNHDDILERFLPLDFGNLRIVNEYIHESPHGRYLVVHGDGFDQVTTNHKWIAVLGSFLYNALLKFNRLYNRYRRWRNREYFSLAKLLKGKVKSAISFVGKYEEMLQIFAKQRGCSGIICGHIHTPADKQIGDIHYLNSGDWVESMTAVVEHHDRTFEVIQYHEFKEKAFGKENKSDSNPVETV